MSSNDLRDELNQVAAPARELRSAVRRGWSEDAVRRMSDSKAECREQSETTMSDRRFVEVVECPHPECITGWIEDGMNGRAHDCFGDGWGPGWVVKPGAEPFSILTQGVVQEIYRDYDDDVIARIAIDVPTDLNEAMIVQIIDADTGDADEQR